MSTVAGGISSSTYVSVKDDAKVRADVHEEGGTMSVTLGEYPATVALIGTPAELERALRQAYSLVLEQIPAPAVGTTPVEVTA